jgi:hypothetical protein
MLTTTIGDKEEARRLWTQADELGAARPLCAAVSRLGLGQTEPITDWYRTSYREAPVPEQLRGMRPLLAGVLNPAHRTEALGWLRSVEKDSWQRFGPPDQCSLTGGRADCR